MNMYVEGKEIRRKMCTCGYFTKTNLSKFDHFLTLLLPIARLKVIRWKIEEKMENIDKFDGVREEMR